MAYFSNSSDGSLFDEQCCKCKYGQDACPIALVQINYNYDQHNDKTGTTSKILDTLVKNSGECTMFKMAKKDLEKPFVDPNQISLF